MTWRIQSFEMNGNKYFSSSKGVIKSTSASADLEPAGLPRALDMSYTVAAGTIFTASGQYRAYRHTWAIKDANNNLVVGDRSGRVIALSTGANQNATLTIRIPPQITTSHVYQVFATSISTSDPGDEMVQIFEANPTTAQITAGTISYEDKIPDAFRNVGVPLYTNTSQEGGANGHTPPPLARTLCEFRGHAFYGNYTDPHRMTMQLVDAASLVATTSTLTIGGVVYTADAAETITTGTFQKWTTGSTLQNVDDTAKSLVRVINGYAANTTVYAYYVSTPDTAPGKILIEERGVGGSAFVAVANNSTCGNCFVPPIPTSGSAYTSIAERRRNRVRVSLQQQAEHVPIYRDIIIGAENDEIQRTIPLQDSVIVIKDRTIWRITGSAFEDFTATILDDTCSIAGRDSAAKLNNTVFMLSNQGFVAVGSQGVQIVGRPIENMILASVSTEDAPNHDTFVAVGHESQRLYICRATDPQTLDGFSNRAYVYNAITRQWSRWIIDPQCMTVVNDRLLYGLNNSLGHVLQERNSRRDGDPFYRDFADESASFTVSSINTSSNTITGTFTAGVDYTSSEVASHFSSINTGWKLYDGDNQYLVISASGSTLTLNTTEGLSGTPTLTAYRPISMTIEWNPITGGNTGELKQWGNMTIRAETHDAYKITVNAANEYDTCSDPSSIAYSTLPTAIDVYVSNDQTKASANDNDFGATAGVVVPHNVIVCGVPRERACGLQLQPRINSKVAEALFNVKSLVVTVRSVGSTKAHQ